MPDGRSCHRRRRLGVAEVFTSGATTRDIVDFTRPEVDSGVRV